MQLGRVNDPGDTGENQEDPNPGQITGLPQIVKIDIGESHTLALDTSGNVWSWGGNEALALGTDMDCPNDLSSPVDQPQAGKPNHYIFGNSRGRKRCGGCRILYWRH